MALVEFLGLSLLCQITKIFFHLWHTCLKGIHPNIFLLFVNQEVRNSRAVRVTFMALAECTFTYGVINTDWIDWLIINSSICRQFVQMICCCCVLSLFLHFHQNFWGSETRKPAFDLGTFKNCALCEPGVADSPSCSWELWLHMPLQGSHSLYLVLSSSINCDS